MSISRWDVFTYQMKYWALILDIYFMAKYKVKINIKLNISVNSILFTLVDTLIREIP